MQYDDAKIQSARQILASCSDDAYAVFLDRWVRCVGGEQEPDGFPPPLVVVSLLEHRAKARRLGVETDATDKRYNELMKPEQARLRVLLAVRQAGLGNWLLRRADDFVCTCDNEWGAGGELEPEQEAAVEEELDTLCEDLLADRVDCELVLEELDKLGLLPMPPASSETTENLQSQIRLFERMVWANRDCFARGAEFLDFQIELFRLQDRPELCALARCLSEAKARACPLRGVFLYAHAKEALGQEREQELEDHLAGCEWCKADLRSLRTLTKFLLEERVALCPDAWSLAELTLGLVRDEKMERTLREHILSCQRCTNDVACLERTSGRGQIPHDAISLSAASPIRDEFAPSYSVALVTASSWVPGRTQRTLCECTSADGKVSARVRSTAANTVAVSVSTNEASLAGARVRFAFVRASGEVLHSEQGTLNPLESVQGEWESYSEAVLELREPLDFVFTVLPAKT